MTHVWLNLKIKGDFANSFSKINSPKRKLMNYVAYINWICQDIQYNLEKRKLITTIITFQKKKKNYNNYIKNF